MPDFIFNFFVPIADYIADFRTNLAVYFESNRRKTAFY